MPTPDPINELNRKTLEATQWLLSSMAEEKITEQEASIALHALWIATSGLVEQETMDNITNLTEACVRGSTSFTVLKHSKAQKTLVLTYDHWNQTTKLFDLSTMKCLAEHQGLDSRNALETKLINQQFEKVNLS